MEKLYVHQFLAGCRVQSNSTKSSVKLEKPEEKDIWNDIKALLDKSQEQTPAAPTTEAGLQTGLTMSKIDAFKVQMRRCWNVPLGAANAEELIVTMHVFLKPDGYLMQRPELVPDGRLGEDRNAAYIAAA